MPDDRSGLWDVVRRALGRLIGAVRVRDLPLSDAAPSPAVMAPEFSPAPRTGAAEAWWQPDAEVVSMPPPQAETGAGGRDVAAIMAAVGADSSLRHGEGRVYPVGLPPGMCAIHPLIAHAFTATVQERPVTLSGGAVSHPAARLAMPGTARLSVDAPALPREARRVLPGRRAAADDSLSLRGGRVRPGMSVMAEVPLVCARLPVPPGVAAAEAFAAERTRLAQNAGVAESDVLLLGVFPRVPVAAVRRLALEDGAALSLWLRPEALEAAAAGKAPRLATLIVGRQRSTGRMLQAVA